MNVIVYQLWGKNDLYIQGLLHNLDQYKKYYPGWIPILYIEEGISVTTPPEVLVVVSKDDGWNNWCWRLNVLDDFCFERAIFRDCDSRLNTKEKACVERWIELDKAAYVSHDHDAHSAPIMAGMWGIKGGILTNVKQAYQDWLTKNQHLIMYGVDQYFLHHWALPQIRGSLCRFNKRFGFPSDKIDVGEYIGQKIQP